MTTRARVGVTVMSLLLLVVAVTGCEKQKDFHVVPLPNKHVLALSSDDIVQIMSRAGFTQEQIVEIGPQLRSGLLNAGAVQVRVGDYVEAIFAVQGDSVYISTRLRGTFIYNIKRGWVQTGDVSNGPPPAAKAKQPPANGGQSNAKVSEPAAGEPRPPAGEPQNSEPAKETQTPKKKLASPSANSGPKLEPLQFYN